MNNFFVIIEIFLFVALWQRGSNFRLPVSKIVRLRNFSLKTVFYYRLFCAESGGIWPKPRGEVTIGNFLATINANSIDILGAKSETPAFDLLMGAARVFRQQVEQLLPK